MTGTDDDFIGAAMMIRKFSTLWIDTGSASNPLNFFCGMCSEESAYALLLCQGSSVPHCRTTISSQGLLHCIIAAGWASLVTCRKVAIFHLLASCLLPRNASASLTAHLRHQQDWWPSALVRLLRTPLAHIPSLRSCLIALTTTAFAFLELLNVTDIKLICQEIAQQLMLLQIPVSSGFSVQLPSPLLHLSMLCTYTLQIRCHRRPSDIGTCQHVIQKFSKMNKALLISMQLSSLSLQRFI